MSALTPQDRQRLWHHMRTPVYSFVALVLLLGVSVALGAIFPSSHAASIIIGFVTVAMALTVLLFSMEVAEEAPLMRFFSALGFFWVAILIGMTALDYLTR